MSNETPTFDPARMDVYVAAARRARSEALRDAARAAARAVRDLFSAPEAPRPAPKSC
jgi:hypothetical protein